MEPSRFLLAVSVVLGVAMLPPAPATVTAHPIAGGILWNRSSAPARAPGERLTLTLSQGVRARDGRSLASAEINRAIETGQDLDAMSAPYAVAVVNEGGELALAADHAGLRHLYAVQGDGWAGVSTSAIDLAVTAGTSLDVEALGEFRLIGHHLDDATAFKNVVKLPPAHVWRLADGLLTTEPFAKGCAADVEPDRPGALAARHAGVLREVVTGVLDHYPDVVLELSGGLDSRMVLAAIPPQRRSGLHALTLRSEGSADARIAAQLARRYGLRLQTVDLGGLADLSPAAACALVLGAARRHDALGQPVSLAVLDWAESQVVQAPRLGGHGGELARGSYLLQPARPKVTPALVDRLAKWWITGNNAVPDDVLEPEFAAYSRARTQQRLRDIFSDYHTDWLSATDEFYLRQRLHRWAGITFTGACLHRIVASPLLDPEVLAIARAVPSHLRRGSRYATQVLDLLDSELARLPLGSGLRPIKLAGRFSMSRRLAENSATGFARKAIGKLGQRLTGASRPANGAEQLASLVVDHWRANPHLLLGVASTGLIREQWLDKLVAGEHGASPATVGFLMNLSVASTVIREGI